METHAAFLCDRANRRAGLASAVINDRSADAPMLRSALHRLKCEVELLGKCYRKAAHHEAHGKQVIEAAREYSRQLQWAISNGNTEEVQRLSNALHRKLCDVPFMIEGV